LLTLSRQRRYVVLEALGSGGLGRLWAAMDTVCKAVCKAHRVLCKACEEGRSGGLKSSLGWSEKQSVKRGERQGVGERVGRRAFSGL
jgi:hypothetical protein